MPAEVVPPEPRMLLGEPGRTRSGGTAAAPPRTKPQPKTRRDAVTPCLAAPRHQFKRQYVPPITARPGAGWPAPLPTRASIGCRG